MPDNNNLDKSDVNSLISFFQKSSGFQHANRFKIEINPPAFLGSGTVPPLFATLVQIPGQSVRYFSDTMAPSDSDISIPLKREYDNRFIIDFIVDKNWACRSFFEGWINAIFPNRQGSTTRNASIFSRSSLVAYYDNVIGNMVITPLDTQDKQNRRIEVYGVWPGSILPTQMFNDNPNTYLTLTVDMVYRYYSIY